MDEQRKDGQELWRTARRHQTDLAPDSVGAHCLFHVVCPNRVHPAVRALNTAKYDKASTRVSLCCMSWGQAKQCRSASCRPREPAFSSSFPPAAILLAVAIEVRGLGFNELEKELGDSMAGPQFRNYLQIWVFAHASIRASTRPAPPLP